MIKFYFLNRLIFRKFYSLPIQLFGQSVPETFGTRLRNAMKIEKHSLRILRELEKSLDQEIIQINTRVDNGLSCEIAMREKILLERIKDKMFAFINEKFFSENLVRNSLLG